MRNLAGADDTVTQKLQRGLPAFRGRVFLSAVSDNAKCVALNENESLQNADFGVCMGVMSPRWAVSINPYLRWKQVNSPGR